MKLFKRITFTLFSLLILGFSYLFLTPWGYENRVFLAEIILSSQHGYLAKYLFLPNSEIKTLNKEIFHPSYVNTNVNRIKITPIKNTTAKKKKKIVKKKVSVATIKLINIQKKYSPTYYYKGKILLISDPKDVKLAITQLKNFGQQINVLAKESGALAAVNAGGFIDPNGEGNGGTPMNIVIDNGKILHTNSGANVPDYVAGLTTKGVLITGFYSANQLIQDDVKYAAGFRPQLISNGKRIPMQGDGGWGIGPRTAIGQTANGTIILLEIDGRQPGYSMGATIVELQNIMQQYGAVNATCMDGGSSSSMYFMGKNITIPSSVAHIPRYLPNAWVIVPPKGQTYQVYDNGKMIKQKTQN